MTCWKFCAKRSMKTKCCLVPFFIETLGHATPLWPRHVATCLQILCITKQMAKMHRRADPIITCHLEDWKKAPFELACSLQLSTAWKQQPRKGLQPAAACHGLDKRAPQPHIAAWSESPMAMRQLVLTNMIWLMIPCPVWHQIASVRANQACETSTWLAPRCPTNNMH